MSTRLMSEPEQKKAARPIHSSDRHASHIREEPEPSRHSRKPFIQKASIRLEHTFRSDPGWLNIELRIYVDKIHVDKIDV
jgi:hypothetical protein